MIEVKATTTDGRTLVDTSVDADSIEYMAEVISIIQSLMSGLKKNDPKMHMTVIKVIADHPNTLLCEDEDFRIKDISEKYGKGELN